MAVFWGITPQIVSAHKVSENSVNQAKQLEFMGIPVHQSKNKLVAQLKGKGFVEKKDAKGKTWYQIQYTSQTKGWILASFCKLV